MSIALSGSLPSARLKTVAAACKYTTMRAQPSLDHAARAQQLLDSVSRVCLIPLDVWTASKRGNLTAIRSIIDSSSAHVDGRDDQGVTPLMHCASNGHLECADYLIAKGAQFKLADHESGARSSAGSRRSAARRAAAAFLRRARSRLPRATRAPGAHPRAVSSRP